MTLLRIRGCARCGIGRLLEDQYGDLTCLACGYQPPTVEPLQIPVVARRRTANSETQEALLMYIEAHPGLTSSEIAKAMGVSRNAMKSRLDTLYTSRLVIKTGNGGLPDPHRWTVDDTEEVSA